MKLNAAPLLFLITHFWLRGLSDIVQMVKETASVPPLSTRYEALQHGRSAIYGTSLGHGSVLRSSALCSLSSVNGGPTKISLATLITKAQPNVEVLSTSFRTRQIWRVVATHHVLVEAFGIGTSLPVLLGADVQ